MAKARVYRLTDKQRAFCREYIIDLNATQAAIRAHYSEKTAEVIGYQQLQKALVIAKVAELQADRLKANKVDADYVIRNIKEVAEACAKTIETENGKQIANPQAALKGFELLGKHLVMFSEKITVDKTVTHKHAGKITFISAVND